MLLTLSQTKLGCLILVQKEARRCAVSANTSKVREYRSTGRLWRVDD